LAAGLGILFFVLGCLVIWYYRESVKPNVDEGDKAKRDPEADPAAANANGEATNNMQLVDPAAAVGGRGEDSNASNVKVTTNDEKMVVVDITGSMKRRGTSNNAGAVDVTDLNGSKKRTNNEREVDTIDLATGKRKPTSNNDRPIDVNSIKRSNNERPVEASNINGASRGTSNNETSIDPSAVSGTKPGSLRGRRSSSNNDRAVDLNEIEQKESEPTPAELEATRKRAASLEKRLEEMSKTHSALAETARRLQEEIAELSSKNNDMLLDGE
jgi:hypothetical protein